MNAPWLKDPIIAKAPAKKRWYHGSIVPWAERPGGCGGTWFYRWVWLLWIGWPYPLRIRVAPNRRIYVSKNYAGCGCCTPLKDRWEYFKWWLAYTYSEFA